MLESWQWDVGPGPVNGALRKLPSSVSGLPRPQGPGRISKVSRDHWRSRSEKEPGALRVCAEIPPLSQPASLSLPA